MKKDKPVVEIDELLWDILPSGKTVGVAPVNFVCHVIRAGACPDYGTGSVGSRQVTGYLPFLYKKGYF